MKTSLNLLLALFLLCRTGHAQGFVNLNFEQAQIVINPGFGAYASNAIPGWTAYYNGNPYPYIVYNTVSLGAASVCLENTGGPVPAIQGKYYIYLQGSSANPPSSAAIGQTAQIPLTAMSLIFWGDAGTPDQSNVSFAGQTLSLNQIGTAPNYNIYAADISAYAGQTGQLLFTGLANGGLLLDNIQFSSSAVPEPSALALAALGTLLLGCRQWRKPSQTKL